MGCSMVQSKRISLVTMIAWGLAALGLSGLAFCPPASAHTGARAQLFVSGFRVEPAGDGWVAKAKLIDYDSGTAAPGFDVSLTGTSSSGEQLPPTPLLDPNAIGEYSARIAPRPGSWSFAVNAQEIPGAAEAVPVRRTFGVTLTPGQQAVALGSRQPAAPGSSASGASRLLWIALTVLVAAMLGAVMKAVRRPRGLSRVGS